MATPEEDEERTAERDFMAAVGARIRLMRTRLGLSTRAAGPLWGFSPATLASYERADRAIPLATLHRLAEAAGVDVRSLIPSTPGGTVMTADEFSGVLEQAAIWVRQHDQKPEADHP